MKIGFATGYSPELSISELVPWAKRADELGLDIAFFSETIQLIRDGISALASFALSTNRIRLGATQVVRLRTPLVIAQTFATLDELSGGRMVLALGACTRMHAQRNGLPLLDPAKSLEENVKVIRGLLAGKEVSYRGSTLTIDGVRLLFKPLRPSIPIWIAATSRKGLLLAGALGDGVLLNAITSPEYARNALRVVKEGAERAGRDYASLEKAALVVAAVAEDRWEALEEVRGEVASKFTPLQAPFNVPPRAQLGDPLMDRETIRMLQRSYEEGGEVGLRRALPTELLHAFTAAGTPSQVEERIQEYKEAGVELPIIRPATPRVMEGVFRLLEGLVER